MDVSAANAATLGVYRMMQGHMSGHADQQAVKARYETTPMATSPVGANKSAGMAFEQQREEALKGDKSFEQYEPVLETLDPIREGEITQLNAGSVDMSFYLMAVTAGTVEGPMPTSALIAQENYRRALRQLA